MSGELWAVDPLGNVRAVPCTYEGIKDGLGGATLDYIHNDRVGFYLDDNGLIEARPMNIPASLMMGMALYGTVVVTAPYPDAEGNTLPPNDETVTAMKGICLAWMLVVEDAGRKGQPVELCADPDNLPPAQIIEFDSEEEFIEFLENLHMPEEEP